MSVVYFSNRLYNLILLMKGLDKFIDETSGTDMFYLETGHIQNLISKEPVQNLEPLSPAKEK